MCPVDGCTNRVKVHERGQVIVFSCQKHGTRMRADRAQLTEEQVKKLLPPVPKSPYHGLPTTDELQYMALASPRTSRARVLKSMLRKIAKRFVGEFVSTCMQRSFFNVRKAKVHRAWSIWFKGHYYEKFVSPIQFGRALRELGVHEDAACKYYKFWSLKEEYDVAS